MELAMEVAGWVGLTVALAIFLSNSIGWPRFATYSNVASVAASGLLIVNGVYHGLLPWVAVNVAWFFVSLFALLHLPGYERHVMPWFPVNSAGSAANAESSVLRNLLPPSTDRRLHRDQ